MNPFSQLIATTRNSSVALPVLLALSAPQLKAQSACAPAPAGLVSLWRGEGTGYDSAGTNSATLLNGVGFAAGEVGQAFTFNGSTTALQVPASGSLDVGSRTGLTIEAWIKPTDATLQQDLVE